MTACRLLPLAAADGPRNMGLDEALLHSAAEGGTAALRFYLWERPTLSLGYFQPAAPALASPGPAGLPWLRRPSGGLALVHHHELTYALALPAALARGDGTPWPLRFHRIIAAALADLGVNVRPCEEGETVKRGEILCFLHHSAGDLLADGHKVVGSAQRKAHGALLQHGGILLAGSPHTPTLPGLAELTGRILAPAEVAAALARHFARATGWSLAPDEPSPGERLAANEAAAGRYADAAWNGRR